MRKSIARRARNQKAPYHCIAAVRGRLLARRSTMAAAARPICSRSWRIPPRRARCATPSSSNARWPGCPTFRPARPSATFATAAVVGAGTMGGGIAMSFADFGYPGEDHGCHAGSAGSRHAAHPRQLRNLGPPRLAGRGRDAAPARAHRTGRRITTTSRTATSSSKRCSRTWTSRSRSSPSWTR